MRCGWIGRVRILGWFGWLGERYIIVVSGGGRDRSNLTKMGRMQRVWLLEFGFFFFFLFFLKKKRVLVLSLCTEAPNARSEGGYGMVLLAKQ